MGPFDKETVKLLSPVAVGEHFVEHLVFNSPVVKDLFYAGSQYPEGSIPFTVCLISSLTGEPENVIEKLVPEDWANAVIIANRTYQRFCGHINLFNQEDKKKNPTPGAAATADIPPKTSSGTSAE
jgi:hypothetical protein